MNNKTKGVLIVIAVILVLEVSFELYNSPFKDYIPHNISLNFGNDDYNKNFELNAPVIPEKDNGHKTYSIDDTTCSSDKIFLINKSLKNIESVTDNLITFEFAGYNNENNDFMFSCYYYALEGTKWNSITLGLTENTYNGNKITHSHITLQEDGANERVVIHEVMHGLGLEHNLVDRTSIMYPQLSALTNFNNDKETLQELRNLYG